MTTLDASIWLLIRDKASPEEIWRKYRSVYTAPEERKNFLSLLAYFAVQASHIPLVVSTLDESTITKSLGAAKWLSDNELATCVNEAIRKGDTAMLDLLLDGDRSRVISQNGSVYHDRFHIIFCPMAFAMFRDDPEILKIILRHYKGEPITELKSTPLHLACRYQTTRSLNYLLSVTDEKAINATDAEGSTPLLLSAMHQPEAIPLLVAKGADVTASQNGTNSLHILCRGCIKGKTSVSLSVDDPVPTLQKARMMHLSDDVYTPRNIAELARLLVNKGLNPNDPEPALNIFCNNIRSNLPDLKVDYSMCGVYKSVISYLATVSNNDILNRALVKLALQVDFLSTQLRRSSDYDNMVKHVDLLEFIRDLIEILLDSGADPNAVTDAESYEKIVRANQFLVPNPNSPVSQALKQMLAAECNAQQQETLSTPTVTPHMSALDIIANALLILYVLQLEEPELHQRALEIIFEMVHILCNAGSKCHQLAQFFVVIGVDVQKHSRLLHLYLEPQSQTEYHTFVEAMLRLSRHPAVQSPMNLEGVRHEITMCLRRFSSLKDLSRRDIIYYLGSRKCQPKIDKLPLPAALKNYLLQFWSTREEQ